MTVSGETDFPTFTLPGALHTIVETVFPQGGQRRARRNAWLAMCSNQVRAWERAEVQRVLEPLAAPQRPAVPRAAVPRTTAQRPTG